MDPLTRLVALATAGAGGAEKTYVEDVFSTWLYTGNGSTQTITNGIDLSGKGGLVWTKSRNSPDDHYLNDTSRGAGTYIRSNKDNSQVTDQANTFSSFNVDGFTLAGGGALQNGTGVTYASWTFRKAPGFCDVVTWTGNGADPRDISHNLGSVPGAIIVKRTDTSGDNWIVYHRSVTNGYLILNNNEAISTRTDYIYQNPTSTTFRVGGFSPLNASGGTYVAYLFAHDAQLFGDGGNQSVIKCGSYTGNGSASGPTIDLGWEPQWVMIKRSDSLGAWWIVDAMRGMPVVASSASRLQAQASNAEDTGGACAPTPTGFVVNTTSSASNTSGGTYIYIAIRRGPMKTPTDATKVFKDLAYTANGAADRSITGVGFPPDLVFGHKRSDTGSPVWYDRLRGPRKYLYSSVTNAEADLGAGAEGTLGQDGFIADGAYGVLNYPNASTYVTWLLRRAPGFFDVVAYTGNGVGNTAQKHNLQQTPELGIIKRRSGSNAWIVYAASLTNAKLLRLDLNQEAVNVSTPVGEFGSTAWSSTDFYLGSDLSNNGSGQTYIAYLFATLTGISKVGSYTGTGSTLSVDCGFTNGARFVMIKRTDSTGDWYVWDTARGIVSGNDPYLLLNSTAAEVTNTDYIDPLNAGFQISSTAPAAINANGGSFIYLAIA